MGEMSPFLLFDGDDDAKMDKRGMHSGKTDVAKKVCCCSAMDQVPFSLRFVQGMLCTCHAHPPRAECAHQRISPLSCWCFARAQHDLRAGHVHTTAVCP